MVLARFPKKKSIIGALIAGGYSVGAGKRFAVVLLKPSSGGCIFNIPPIIRHEVDFFVWEMEYGGGQFMLGEAVVVCDTTGHPLDALSKPLIPSVDIEELPISGHFYLNARVPYVRVAIAPRLGARRSAITSRSNIAITQHYLVIEANRVYWNSRTEFCGPYDHPLPEKLSHLNEPARQAFCKARQRQASGLCFGRLVA